MFARRRIGRRVMRRTARRMFFRMALAEEDVKMIEKETGQPADSLAENQLLSAMQKLGIKKLELDDDS